MSKNKAYFGIIAVTLVAGLAVVLLFSFYSVKAADRSSPTIEVCTPPGSSDPGSSNLISYWPLDESAGATIFVDQVSAHNGTCTGGTCPTAGVTGIASTAVDFTSADSDVIVVPSTTDYDFLKSDSFSIGLWVKTTQDCTDNKVFVGRYRTNTTYSTWWLGCVPDGDDSTIGYAAFRLREPGTPDVYRQVESTTQINDGNWHYIVGVREYDAGVVDDNRIYVDGSLENTISSPVYPVPPPDFTWNGDVTMGAYDLGGPGYYYQGILDEVTIYGRALGGTEIDTYNNSCNPSANTPPTVGDVNFSTNKNIPLIITEAQLLANSSDADSDSLSVNAVDATSTQGGTITGAIPGPFTYTPPTDFTGNDSFKFSVFDGTDSTQGTANIQVKEPILYFYLPIILRK